MTTVPGEPVRVAHVIGRLSTGAGVQIVVRRLITNARPERVELHVVTARGRREPDRLEELPAQVHMVGHTGPYRGMARLKVMWGVARHVRRIRPDVVQLHSGITWMGLLARFAAPRAAFVLEVHDAPGSGRHGAMTDRAEGWWVRAGGATAVCHSSSVEAEVRRRWHPPDGRVVTFPLAVDTDLFRPRSAAERSEWRRSEGIPEDMVLVIVVGRLAPSKRFDRAVEGVATLAAEGLPVGLVVVGQGALADQLREQADRLGAGGRVWFVGLRQGEELARAYAAADILCSASEYEGFGLTLIEGMATELPAVAVAVGGVTDLVVDGVTGRLVDPVDADGPDSGLLAGLRELAVDAGARRSLGVAGRQRVLERFGVDAFVESFTELYEQLAGSAGRPWWSGSRRTVGRHQG